MNISEEAWQAQTGGRQVISMPQEQLVAEADKVYSRYGIKVNATA